MEGRGSNAAQQTAEAGPADLALRRAIRDKAQ
jgi:hypothetical protein